MGWCNPLAKGSGTFTNLCSLESGTASAASGVQMSWENSGSALFLMSTFPTEYTFKRYPFPGATTGQPFFFAMTGQGTGTTDLRAYWMAEGETDFQMVVGAGKSFTSGALFLGNGSYNDWSNTRFANIKVYKKALSPDELVREWRSPIPVRTADLNSWSNLESTADLVDYANGNTWSVIGTCASGLSPALSMLDSTPSPIRRIGSIYLPDTGGGDAFDSRSAIIPFNLRGPGKPMGILGPDGRPVTWVETATGGGDVTVAITGVSATGAAGSVVPSTTVPVTGVAGTSAVGTVAPGTSVPVTGVAGTSAVGSIVPSTTVALTGVAGTSAAGTVVPSTTVPVTGLAGTAAVGSVTPATTVGLTGVQATGAVGSVVGFADTFDSRTAAVPFLLRGPGKVAPALGPRRDPLTWTESAPTNNVTVAISGVSASASAGNVTPSTTVPVTGTAATSSVGTVAPATAVPVTGVVGAGAAGTVTPGASVAASGVAGTAASGTVAPSTTVGATGVSATTAVGTVTVSTGANVTVAITGVSATASVGTVGTSGGDTAIVPVRRTVSGVLARFDASLALVTAGTSTTGGASPACRFTLEKEPLPLMDGRYFLDVEEIHPGPRNRSIGEAYWEMTVVMRVAYQRGGGDAAGGDRQSVMRDGLGDSRRFADVVENPTNYDSPTTGISEIRYLGAVRAATFKRGEIWETRFFVRWRSDSYTG